MTLSDKDIKKRILDDLYWNSSIDASKIQVLVDNGRVTLSGTVPSLTAKYRAADAGFRIHDVVTVTNNIVVRVPDIPVDPEIRQSALNYLAADSDMEKTDIRVFVKDGVVTLEGSVDEYWKKSQADRIVCRVRGVCDIVNKLSVVPTRSVADKAIADDVRTALERNINGSLDCTTVKVEHGIVTLSGTLNTWTAWRAALDAAEFTRGVINVIDHVTVVSPAVAAAC